MTREETAQILSIIKANWYSTYNNMPKADAEAMVNLWHLSFKEFPFPAVQEAVIYLINTKKDGFPPQIAQVKDCLMKLTSKESWMTPQEAWALVYKACRNGTYGYKEEYAKLPPILQAAVGSPEQLKVWARQEEDELQTVIASNFQRSFTIAQKRETELQMLPQAVRNAIGGMNSTFAMPEPYEWREASCEWRENVKCRM